MRIKIYTVAVPQLQLMYMFEFLSINTHGIQTHTFKEIFIPKPSCSHSSQQ